MSSASEAAPFCEQFHRIPCAPYVASPRAVVDHAGHTLEVPVSTQEVLSHLSRDEVPVTASEQLAASG